MTQATAKTKSQIKNAYLEGFKLWDGQRLTTVDWLTLIRHNTITSSCTRK